MDKELQEIWSQKIKAEKLNQLESDLLELRGEKIQEVQLVHRPLWTVTRRLAPVFLAVFLCVFLYQRTPEPVQNETYAADIAAIIYMLDDSELYADLTGYDENFTFSE